MKKLILTLTALLILASSAFAGSYRVTYTYRGLIQRTTVQAESSQDARRTIQAIIPGAVVTGAHKTK